MFKIADGRDHFYQWDLDRKLLIEDESITEMHFCNKTDDCSLVVEVYEQGGKRFADVPNILLQDAWNIRAFAYCGDCYTKQSAIYKVQARSKPADYVYTETEVKRWETLAADVEEALQEVEAAINEAEAATNKAENAATHADEAAARANAINDNVSNALKGRSEGAEIVRLDGVSTIAHNVACKVERKNLLPPVFGFSTWESNGITFVNNQDGSITINGTSTAGVSRH